MDSVYLMFVFLSNLKKHISKSVLFFLFPFFLFGQTEESTFLSLYNSGEYEKAKNYANKVENSQLALEFIKFLDVIQYGEFDQIDLKYIPDSKKDKRIIVFNNINKALKYYLKDGSELKAYTLLKESFNISEKIGNKSLICLTSKLLLEIYSRTLFTLNDKSYKYVIENYKNYANNNYDRKLAEYYDYKITMRFFFQDSTETLRRKYNKINSLYKNDGLNFNTAKLYLSNSAYHNRITRNTDSSFYFLNKAKPFFAVEKGYFENEKSIALKINLASLYFKENKFNQSLDELSQVKINRDDYIYRILDSYVNLYKYYNYNALGDSINALIFHNKALNQQLVQNQTRNLQLVSEYETKYESEKKEKQNLLLEQQKTKNQNIAIALGGSLALGSIIAFLIFKNTKRKQKLAEQEKEIESQKLATVLKEQELTAIDAMIEGQEKERQRIANDLHDDLGGLMATVKLHFNALKDKDSPELFEKTNSLIEEAYQKVRTVAHAKNSGVIAKQGLLKAVENMAEKISASNKIRIEVIDHGLDNRLENSLELTLFRIIQELITNVIKHAEATEVTIHLTNHDDTINIMVEDNGKGFNPNQVTKTNKGMGISSIDKRVEHLDGKLTIESEKNKGTTVIIDIPI